MKRIIFNTEDGSSSIRIPDLNESYHSKHGAIIESRHVFIKNGLYQTDRTKVRIFEMGFGTGLNAYLSYLTGQEMNAEIEYHTIEKYPLSTNETAQLNFPESLEQSRDIFDRLHSCEWNKEVLINNGFALFKTNTDLKKAELLKGFNLIYFDAFGPDIQPELWTEEIMKLMYMILDSKGIFVTYSAKGQVRRNLISAGFQVERIPGPPGKREMLRAIKH